MPTQLCLQKCIITHNNRSLTKLVAETLRSLGCSVPSFYNDTDIVYSITTKNGNVTYDSNRNGYDRFKENGTHEDMSIEELLDISVINPELSNGVIVTVNGDEVRLRYEGDVSICTKEELKTLGNTIIAFYEKVGRTVTLTVGCRTFNTDTIRELLRAIE